MTLSAEQQLFTKMIGDLIVWIYQQPGLAVTLGECYRPPEMAAIYASRGIGIKNSMHCQRLAIDLNLFVNGAYATQHDQYKVIGEKWESMNKGNKWGGRWERDDSDHFEYNGE